MRGREYRCKRSWPFMLPGAADRRNPIRRSVDQVAAAAGQVYNLFGHPSRLRIEHPDYDHDFPGEMRRAAYELFDAVLR